ncbi:hypothetical protein, partial [Prevotella sp. HMSC073D09]|uniref:hypothetical protein n=1 Tax=Prevotella sp. HMSC073D09 TaxID=1739459 RepID=UPI001AEFC889
LQRERGVICLVVDKGTRVRVNKLMGVSHLFTLSPFHLFTLKGREPFFSPFHPFTFSPLKGVSHLFTLSPFHLFTLKGREPFFPPFHPFTFSPLRAFKRL